MSTMLIYSHLPKRGCLGVITMTHVESERVAVISTSDMRKTFSQIKFELTNKKIGSRVNHLILEATKASPVWRFAFEHFPSRELSLSHRRLLYDMYFKEGKLLSLQANGTRIACYTITDKVSGKFYIGSTGNLYSRLSSHRGRLLKGTHRNKLMQSLHDSGAEWVYDWTEFDSVDAANKAELDAISSNQDNPKCINIAIVNTKGVLDTSLRCDNSHELKKYRKDNAGELNKKKRKRCIIGGDEYPSVREAARQLSTSQAALSWRINSVNFPDYYYKEP